MLRLNLTQHCTRSGYRRGAVSRCLPAKMAKSWSATGAADRLAAGTTMSSAATISLRWAAAWSATLPVLPRISSSAAAHLSRCRRLCWRRWIAASAARPRSTARGEKSGRCLSPAVIGADRSGGAGNPAAPRIGRRLCRGGQIWPDRRSGFLRLV